MIKVYICERSGLNVAFFGKVIRGFLIAFISGIYANGLVRFFIDCASWKTVDRAVDAILLSPMAGEIECTGSYTYQGRTSDLEFTCFKIPEKELIRAQCTISC